MAEQGKAARSDPQSLVPHSSRRGERMFSSMQLCPLRSEATGEVGGSRPKAAPLRQNSAEVRTSRG